MQSKVRLLSLVVSFTLILLAVGATLVVLGIFNEALNWDIFGPRLEALLYGVFGSCMALAGFGVMMTLIIATQESVRDFKRFVQARTSQVEIPDAPKRDYAFRLLLVVAMMAFLVGLCSLVNHVVLLRRCEVFKRLSLEQVSYFEPTLLRILSPLPAPPVRDVPKDLYDVVRTIDNLEFVVRATVYMPDPVESGALWGFTAWRNCYTNTDGFARFFVAKDFEKAMRRALDGDMGPLAAINARHEFIWYKVLSGSNGVARAVIRIDGDNRHSFRDYRFGD